MNSKAFTRKALMMCLFVAILATLSIFASAASGKAIGELTLNKNVNGEFPQVKVNGETVQTGHTVFASNTIATPENAGATVNLGKYGSIELAANSSISFNVTNAGLVGSITAGQLTSFSESITIKTLDGNSISPRLGESVSANGTKTKVGDDERDSNGKCIDKDGDGVLECDSSGGAWWIWTLVFGGAAAGILIATLSDNNRVALGGGTTVVSPTR